MKFLNGYERQQWFYISNILSLSRIIFAILFVNQMMLGNKINMAGWACLAVLSDGLDGYLARKLNRITQLGILLDPLADKISMAIVVVGFYIDGCLPLRLVIALIVRDALITAGVVYMIVQDPENFIVPMSNWVGKLAITAIAASLLIIFFVGGYAAVLAEAVIWSFIIGSIMAYINRFAMFRQIFRQFFDFLANCSYY